MKIYSIYSKSAGDDTDPIIIKQGFSIWAAIFNVLWALYHRMWSIAAVTLFVAFSISYFQVVTELKQLAYLIDIATMAVFGFFASEIREFHAGLKGYELTDVIVAADDDEAEMKYTMRIAESASSS